MHRKRISEISATQLRRRIGVYPILSRIPELGAETRSTSSSNSLDSRPGIEELNCDEHDQIGQGFQPTSLNVFSSSESEEEVGVESVDIGHSALSLRFDLAQWSLKNNITIAALTSLLHTLRVHNVGTDELPLDGRTLLETPKQTPLVQMPPGEYCHFGVAEGIRVMLSKAGQIGDCKVIRLQVNVDGLPISKSSSKQFWPILCSISEPRAIDPVPIGIYCGMGKPSSSTDLMVRFVDEMQILLCNGLEFEGQSYKVELHAFICDAPAKAFIKCIKGHNGYFSCGSCKIEGKYVENRVVFCGTSMQKRTNAEFRAEPDELSDDTHKVGISALERLPIDMVEQFPHDYMHLVCLGVTKKLILLWLRGRDKRYRLSARQVDLMSNKLEMLAPAISSDFSRKPRSMKEIDRWKATELRLFLLYTGPVVLNGIIQEDVYNHFMTLHIAIRILCSVQHSCLNEYSRDLLLYFVQCFQSIYGESHMSFNIHGLLHLAEDSMRFGPLDRVISRPV